ncbi:hypothetical protein [Flavobacterium sp. KACC 22761]|uniref:hypothetical protein n=1 Tax=Flavobacterium sp. KACC 22761 TaxID=3092665 RepID=UPI002A751457|nr:hypothetical protein [Flavobacterium sp. KACC 22761]WPO79629.1 hypothetical protein SCB73_04425 [Flavobacterium sp. KACC 22761]
MEKNNINNFFTINRENWKETKFISGRIATDIDVKNGFATFSINKAKKHTTCDIDLPTLAQLIDYEEPNDDLHEVVVVIQLESNDDEYDVVGYRKFNGETGSCLANDVKWLRDWEIENFK